MLSHYFLFFAVLLCVSSPWTSAVRVWQRANKHANLISAAACGWWHYGSPRSTSRPRPATESSCWRSPAEAEPWPRLVSSPWRQNVPYSGCFSDLPAACSCCTDITSGRKSRARCATVMSRPGGTWKTKTPVPTIASPSNPGRNFSGDKSDFYSIISPLFWFWCKIASTENVHNVTTGWLTVKCNLYNIWTVWSFSEIWLNWTGITSLVELKLSVLFILNSLSVRLLDMISDVIIIPAKLIVDKRD